MTYQQIPGDGFQTPTLLPALLASNSVGSMLMDASTERIAFCGQVWNKDRSSKNITKVGVLAGTITLNAASTIRISIQSLSTSSALLEPSGTILGATNNGLVTEASTTYTTNAWHQSAALGETVTVANGAFIAVVIDYGSGGVGFTAADVFNLRGFTQQQNQNFPCSKLYTGTWGNNTTLPNVILEFDDGTFGTLRGAFPFSATYNSPSFLSSSTPDEYCMEFQFPFKCKVDGCMINGGVSSNLQDFEVVLYDGTTAMTNGTIVVEGSYHATNVQRQLILAFPGEVELAANTTYRLAVKSTSASAATSIFGFDVANANHFQAHGIGTSGILNTRTDLGAWGTAVTTRRPYFHLNISSFDDGAGGGGGLAMPVTGRICA